MPRQIVFDFDGTLADSEGACFELLNELAGKHGYRRIDREQWSELKLQPYAERLRRLGVPLLRVPLLAAEARRQYRTCISSLRTFPGIVDCLQHLKEAGCTLHVLSSNSAANIQQFLAVQQIDVFASVNSERNFFGKHTALRRLMERRGLSPSDMLYVADEVRDVEACRKAGVQIISAAWGFDPSERLREVNPGLTATTPADVVRLVRTLALRLRPAEDEDALGWALATP